jgi:hypothetical protein
MKKQANAGVSAVPTMSGKPKASRSVVNLPVARDVRRANSARTPAAASSAGSVTSADLPTSYSVDYELHSFLDGSWNIKPTSVYGADNIPDDAEIYLLHGVSDNFVAYTRLYVNQDANVTLDGGWDIKAFDPGVFPGDLGLTEISALPPRRLPNSAAESSREQFSTLLGYIPVVAQVVGVVNLVQDAIDLQNAQRRGDIDDIADEQADVKKDLIDQILGVQQLQAAIVVVTLPVTLPVTVAFGALYFWAISQCSANPDSESCAVLI